SLAEPIELLHPKALKCLRAGCWGGSTAHELLALGGSGRPEEAERLGFIWRRRGGERIFFVLPCIESYSKVDLRTVSFDVPPQESQSSSRSILPAPSLPLFPGTAHCRQAKADQLQISCWPPPHRSLSSPGPAIFLAILIQPTAYFCITSQMCIISSYKIYAQEQICLSTAAGPKASGKPCAAAGARSPSFSPRPPPHARRQVLTKDSVTVSVDAVCPTQTVSVANVENAHHSTRLLAQTTLRNVLGTKDLAEILSERDSISTSM
uniref:Uncharacterized protein n=1 Tax=Macrostomum lignano TaxID=282301 RepID=A0A1I8FAZ2_9PLAT